MLTPEQTHQILGLLEKQIVFFAASTLGDKYLTDQEKQTLSDNGIDHRDVYDPSKDMALQNFHLGMLSDILGDKEVKKLTFPDLVKYIQSGQYIPLNQKEIAVVDSIKMQSMSDIRANKGKIFQDTNNVVGNSLSTIRANQEQFLREQITQGVSERRSRKQIASDIARLTGDWSRNFNKSVQYISHTALNEGRMAMIERRYGNKIPAKVYFQVQQTACEHCARVYLKDGLNSEPILFSLSELQKNGSNIGRKTKEWKATIGAIHVHCRCLLTEYIEGQVWDGEKFIWPPGGYKSTIDRPKIRIFFNGKEHLV